MNVETILSNAVMTAALGFFIRKWMGSMESTVKELKDKHESKVSENTCKERTAVLVNSIQGMVKDMEGYRDDIKDRDEIAKACKHECTKFIFKHKHTPEGVVIP